LKQTGVLIAGRLEDEVRERLGAAGILERPVVREVVECGGEDGAYIELSRKVDDVDGEGISCRRSWWPWGTSDMRLRRFQSASVVCVSSSGQTLTLSLLLLGSLSDVDLQMLQALRWKRWEIVNVCIRFCACIAFTV
jgi:hypothetical protein